MLKGQENVKESVASVKKEVKEAARGFREFIVNYGVGPLAIGVVIGTAVNDLVKSLVDGLFSPLIALLSPDGQLQTFKITFHGAVFKLGMILNSLLSFIIIALMVYFFAKVILRNEDLLKKK